MEETTERVGVGWGVWWRWVLATVLATALAGEVIRRLVPAVLGYGIATVVVVGVAVPALVGVAQGLMLRRYGVRARSWVLATVAGSLVVIAWIAPWVQDASVSQVTWVDEAGRVVRSWEGEPLRRGQVGGLMALGSDGAFDWSQSVHGVVAVGSLGSGVGVTDGFDDGAALGALIGWLLGGASLGVAQWLVLRHRVRRAYSWVAAALLGKVAGGIAASIALASMSGSVTTLAVPIGISAATVAVNSAVQATVGGVVIAWLLHRPRVAATARDSANPEHDRLQSQR